MKLVYITSRFPYPIEKGDKLRAYYQIRHLGRSHEVHLLAVSHTAIPESARAELLKHCASVRIFNLSLPRTYLNCGIAALNALPIQIGYFYDRRIKRKLQEAIIELQPDHLFVQLVRTAEYVRNMPYRKSLDYMDAFSYGALQRAGNSRFPFSWFFRRESSLLRRYEREIYCDFDRHFIISDQDRQRLPVPYKGRISILANGVDTDYFAPDKSVPRQGVLFVGNMGYAPNIEAAQFLARKVMPLVWESYPDVDLTLAGARPSVAVRRLEAPRVKVTGWVDDIRPYYNSCSVFVAPMLSGMGIQNKMLEAMAMKCPCVTTAIVNNAIGAEDGVDLAVANTEVEIADEIHHFLKNKPRAERFADAARRFVVDHFSWEAKNKILNMNFKDNVEERHYSLHNQA